jgi:hypothetical protein
MILVPGLDDNSTKNITAVRTVIIHICFLIRLPACLRRYMGHEPYTYSRRGKANPPTPTLQVYSRCTNYSLMFTFRGRGLVILVLVISIHH